jgi:hypothetical protein
MPANRPDASAPRGVRIGALAGAAFTATAAALIAVAPVAHAAGVATPSDFLQLRICESGNDYAINTGNGYFGAYQFSLGTWHGLGYGGYPQQASPELQDQAARSLQAARGWSAWPGCSARLGLSFGRSYGAAPVHAASRSQARPILVSAGRSPAGPRRTTATAPPFDGTTLSTALVRQRRQDVITWQRRMAARGWSLSVDGHFGPQSAHIARLFATEKRLATRVPGTVDARAWRAAWTSPIT